MRVDVQNIRQIWDVFTEILTILSIFLKIVDISVNTHSICLIFFICERIMLRSCHKYFHSFRYFINNAKKLCILAAACHDCHFLSPTSPALAPAPTVLSTERVYDMRSGDSIITFIIILCN